MPEYPAPVSCKLHEDELKDIKSTVKDIDSKLDNWFGPDGTVWSMNDRLIRVESSTERSHERITEIENTAKAETKRLNALAVKVAGIAAVLSSIGAAIISHFK